MNTVRIFQWLSGQNNVTFFSGAIGDDTQGKNLIKRLERANMESHLQKVDLPTAKAVSLVTQANRCIVADIAAAAQYDEEFFERNVRVEIERSQLFYQSAWFLLGNNVAKMSLKIAKKLRREGKTFMFNIGTDFQC